MTQPLSWAFPDGSGITASWTPAPPPPVVPPMLVGNASGPANLARYPGTTACTIFFGPTHGFSAASVTAVPPGVHPIVCIKDTYDSGVVAAQLATAAETGREFSVVHHHEPEADMTAAQFLAESAPYAKACAAWPNVSFGIKLLRYSLIKPGMDFRQWIPQGCDWVGLDAYDQTGLIAADDLIEIVIQMGEFAGVPGAVTEFMWLRATGDTAGVLRAAQIARMFKLAATAEMRFCLPWDALGSKTTKYPLGIPFGPFPLASPEYGATMALIATQGVG